MMTNCFPATAQELQRLDEVTQRAANAIPPLWPLSSSVAVNPFLGQGAETLAQAGARLARVAGAAVTMPRGWYQERIVSGAIRDDDLSAALASAPVDLRPIDLGALKAAAREFGPSASTLPTVADLAARISGLDWPAFIAERFGAWAASYFDQGQALWAAPRGRSAYAAWRAFATHDLAPEITGLQGFATHVCEAPENAREALARVAHRLGLGAEAMDTYFHQLLMTLGGWAQYARFQRWQAELAGRSDDTITDLLSIRMIWEEAIFERYAADLPGLWETVKVQHATPIAATRDGIIDAILQEAWERAGQRALAAILSGAGPVPTQNRRALQTVFCIDVRSEVFRRALEALDPRIGTLGFAGFFGLATSHRRFASDISERRLPVLLNPALSSCSEGPTEGTHAHAFRIKARGKRAWSRFKLAAISSFAFVEATGPLYIGKLLRDALRLPNNRRPYDPAPRLHPDLDLPARVKTAEAVLRAMSLTTDFARVVVLVGHGADVLNNPYASTLQCGACGGHSGEVNARLLASLLNDPQVREELKDRGIVIPSDTLFLGALHETTTDNILLYMGDHPSPPHRADLQQAKAWFAAAGKVTRTERARRLPRATGEQDIWRRGRDWAEIRPEWALAGCQAFIAAPRARTAGKRFGGRAFLHDYNWRDDKGFAVLELIMTAPVMVANWISLQYYGSTVAPQVFGSGNKLLHNVTGGFGVVEGNGGVLRAGIPWQSVHDGERYAHDPLRLAVCIEAPCEAISDVLRRQEPLRALFDNRWLHLFALDDFGTMASRYAGDLQWSENR